MIERIISDEVLQSIQRTCYEAGKAGREVYTVRGADGPEIIRCRDCKWFLEGASPHDPDGRYDFCTQHGFDFKGSNGFCAWAERREA